MGTALISLTEHQILHFSLGCNMVFKFYLLPILVGGCEEFLRLLSGLPTIAVNSTGQGTNVRVLPSVKFF